METIIHKPNTSKNIYQKLQEVRYELDKLNLKKSGRNKFSNFSYYELHDFLPAINKLNNEYKLLSAFSIVQEAEGSIELGRLTIINANIAEEKLIFEIPTAEVEIGKKGNGSGGAQPIQNLGGKTTYMRRYLYMIAYEIAESDWVDPNEQIQTKNLELSESNLETINNTQDLEQLASTCKNLKNTLDKRYFNSLMTAYNNKKTELEQNENL